jgi:probable HAF family extracellular repeat protein
MTRTLSLFLLIAGAAFVLSPAPAAQSGPKYTLVPVGDFGADTVSWAHDVNNANDVVGMYYHPTPFAQRAFLYRNGVNTDIGTLGGSDASAQAINATGLITGWSYKSGGGIRAFLYNAGTMTDLGSLSPSQGSIGFGINSLGHVVGTSSEGFLWNGTNMSPISSPGWTSLLPNDINTAGAIVGSASNVAVGSHAFQYAGGVMTDLGTLVGHPNSAANAINDAGTIVGWSSLGSFGPYTAVQWSNGTITSLGALPGLAESVADDINAHGVVVGSAFNPTGNRRAVRWSGGAVVDLNNEIAPNSGLILERALAINDNGAIVGEGWNAALGKQRAFLLLPITDTTAPAISCGSANGAWHASNVSILCTASDSQSGLANPADASFSLSTSVAAGTENANALTGTRTVCDNAGNCATAGPIGGNKIDRLAPAISIISPAATTYQFLSSHTASYGCADGGSGVAMCNGPVWSGSPLDTTTVGARTFTVTTSDAVGNISTATVQYQVVATNWPQFHNGADRGGLQLRETLLNTGSVAGLSLAWAAPTWSSIYASPVVVDGVAYTPSSTGYLYAFSAAYGNFLWATPIGGTYLSSSPAVVDGRAFIGSDDGNVYAINAANGSVLWKFQTNGPVYASPTVAGGIVYVGSWDANLYALDAKTGKPVWQQNVVYPVRGDAAVSNGMVYLANDMLYAFDAATGTQIWAAFPWWWSGVGAHTAAVLKDRVVVGADDGSVWAIDALNGGVIWTASTTYGTGGISSIPAIDSRLRLVYVGATDGSLYAFHLASGALMWSSFLGGWVNSAAAANGVVYAGALGAVHAVDARSGARLWTFHSAGAAVSSPAVADGTVYVASTDTNLYAFRR